jgi:uncharacterized phage-associated protein
MWNQKKILNAVLLVANQLETADFHRIFKIFYFADREHLATYGRTILGDQYIAMKDGPVPSRTYDLLKVFREDAARIPDEDRLLLEARAYVVIPKRIPDKDYLSASEIDCINRSIADNKRLTFEQLSIKSHGEAWTHATINNEIALLDIAQEAHASPEMMDYIREIDEAEAALKWL